MIGTITLNPSIDQHWTVEALAKDDTNRALDVIETAGGKGINVSKVVRELGGKTRAYALLGGWAGTRLQELAVPLDFPVTPVAVKDNTRINMVLTDVKDRTQTRVSAPGPLVSAKEFKAFVQKMCASHQKHDFWAFGGSLPRGLKAETYRDLIRVLQKNGTPCVLDTDNEALKRGIEARPFMIKPNEHEMQRLCGKKLLSVSDYLKEARILVSRRGIRLVVVSLAAKGALFVTEERAFLIPGLDIKTKSKLGAGDSLIGGLLCGFHQKMPLEEAAKLGVAASHSAVLREAPRLCLKSDIPKLVQKLKIQRF